MRLRDVSQLVVRRGLAAVCVLFSCAAAIAQTCDYGTYPWGFYNGSLNGGQEYPSQEAVCEAFRVSEQEQQPAFTYTGFTIEATSSTAAGYCHLSRTHNENGGVSSVQRSFAAKVGTLCMPPPEVEECDDIGESKIVSGPPGQTGQTWCEDVCRYKITFGMCGGESECDYVAEIVSSCGAGGPGGDPPEGPPEDIDDDDGEPSDSPPEECVDVGDGEYCIGGPGPGDCGYFNDAYTCIDQVRDDECKVAADGSRLCGDQVKGTPPAPDSGTPGEMAAPDGTITVQHEDGSTTTYNYYSSGTVSGSSRDPGTTGANSASGAGSPHAPSQGDADGDGQDDCEQSGACGGGDAIVSTGPCYSDEEGFVSIVSACAQDAFTYIGEALYEENDWYTLVSEMWNAVPTGGVCPSAEFAAWGETYDFGDVACDLVEDATPTLGLMFLILWGFVGIRILIGTFAEA